MKQQSPAASNWHALYRCPDSLVTSASVKGQSYDFQWDSDLWPLILFPSCDPRYIWHTSSSWQSPRLMNCTFSCSEEWLFIPLFTHSVDTYCVPSMCQTLFLLLWIQEWTKGGKIVFCEINEFLIYHIE